jgi:hypothetical protein
MSSWRTAVAVGIGGFCVATNLLGFDGGEARADATGAAPAVESFDEGSTELVPSPLASSQPGCGNSGGRGKWECTAKGGLHDTTGGKAPCAGVGTYLTGPAVRGASETEACATAKHALNATVPEGCYPKHVKCKCSKR